MYVCVCICLHLSLQLCWELALARFNCALRSNKDVRCASQGSASHCFCHLRSTGSTPATVRDGGAAWPCSAGSPVAGCRLSSPFVLGVFKGF